MESANIIANCEGSGKLCLSMSVSGIRFESLIGRCEHSGYRLLQSCLLVGWFYVYSIFRLLVVH
jgi:hypothetical protein